MKNERKEKSMKMHETRWWNACTVSPPRESTSGAQHSSYVISQPPCSKCILSILLLLSINISHQATNPSIISMSLFVICTLHPKNLPNCQHQYMESGKSTPNISSYQKIINQILYKCL